MIPPVRLLVANLAFEEELRLRRSKTGTVADLPAAAQRVAADLGTLARVLTDPSDRLWTMLPVAPDRLPTVEGLPRPELVSGPLDRLEPPERLLAWGESPAVAALRRQMRPTEAPAPAAGRASTEEAATAPPGALQRMVWQLRESSATASAVVQHRSFQLRCARSLNLALPGSRMIADPAELERHLAGGGASHSADSSWVLKAPYSAAGRERLIGQGPPSRGDLERLASLLDRHGGLLFEPWLPREADFGAVGTIADDTSPQVIGTHRQLVDRRGAFRGASLLLGGTPPGISEAEDRLLRQTLARAAAELATAGYRGPFGIDAYRYRTAGGESRLHPLGEINARLSFGWLLHATADRFTVPQAMRPGDRVTLQLGPRSTGPAPPPGHATRVIELLRPAPGRPSAASLEISPGRT